MRRLESALAAILLLCAAQVSALDGFPRVIYPAGHSLPDHPAPITVESPLLQVEVHPGLVVTAQRGTRFSLVPLDQDGASHELQVLAGAVTLLDFRANSVVQLSPGRFAVSATGHIESISAASDDPTNRPDSGALTPRYRQSDALMTQQQKYLDSLKIDVKDINKVLIAPIIRFFFPRR